MRNAALEEPRVADGAPRSSDAPLTGAERRLRELGISTVFGYPGGAIMPLYDALYDGGVRHILTRHEQGAALAAIGHARSTGGVGVCIATSGPGATNLVTGLADALAGLGAGRGHHRPGRLSPHRDRRLPRGRCPRPVPCLHHAQLPGPRRRRPAGATDHPAHEVAGTSPAAYGHGLSTGERDVTAARELIRAARRPVLYVGGGVVTADAVAELRDLLAATGIPSTSTAKALGAVPGDTDLHLGMLGMHGAKAADLVVQECDLLIVVGARFDDRVSGDVPSFAPRAKGVHLDVDAAEIGKIRRADVSLLGDLRVRLPALAARPDIDPWRDHVRRMVAAHGWRYDHPGDGIYAPALLKELSDRMPARTVVTTDVGQHQMWACQHVAVDHPTDFVTSGGLGTMGFGLPAAVGAQLGRPHDTVVCVTGDGSILMNIQELATLGCYHLPVKILLLDNQRLGMVRHWQQLFFDGRYSETTLDDNPDFVALAAAFGIPGRRITTASEVSGGVADLLAAPTAYLLHVSIDAAENLWPLVPPGASNTEMLEDAP